MRAVVQRVSEASVVVDGEVVGSVGGPDAGADHLLVLLGITHDDTVQKADALARKVHGLRILHEEVSVADTGGSVLVVSQFTLYGDTRRGRRPSWLAAARPEVAEPLVERVVAELRSLGAHVGTGRFRADMAVELVNDGPVTLLIEV